MSKSICKVRLLDEVAAVVVGLHGDHLDILYKKYSIPAPNYFFNPLYKLGRWDGKIHFMQANGRTYIYLLEEIIPRIVQMGYEIEIEDLRGVVAPSPSLIKDDMFADVLHPDTGKPTTLRYYQRDGINTLIEHGFGIVKASTGAGKAQPLTSNVLTPHGWRTMGGLVVGDTLISPDGSTTTVTGIFPQGEKQIYKVTFHDGASTLCCDEHLWTVNMPVGKLSSAKTTRQTVPLSHIRNFLSMKSSTLKVPGNVTVQTVKPFEYATPHVCDIHPYVLGALLGDGNLSKSNTLIFSSADEHIIAKMSDALLPLDITLKKKRGVDYGVTKRVRDAFPPTANPLVEQLARYGLMNVTSHTKFIPCDIKHTSLAYRLDVLKGLFDTDGTVDKRGNVSFTTVSERLAHDVRDLLWGVGAACSITSRQPTYTYKGEKRIGSVAFTLHVSLTDSTILFSLPRKLERCKTFGHGRIAHGRRIVSVEPHSIEPAQCIMVDHPDHLYVTDDYIVTHNTILCTGLCKAYGDVGIKTLTIVPSQDLIKQTKKVYIHSGLDTGEYSGTNKDLNHDHVVSTWQALKNNPKVIELFQMVLVDECLSGDTLISMSDGSVKPIRDIVEGDHILSMNEITGDVVDDTVVKRHTNLTIGSTEKMYELVFDGGVTIHITGNHKMFTLNRGWVRADELVSDDDVVQQ